MEKIVDMIYRLKSKCVSSDLEIMKKHELSPAEYNGIAAINAGEKVSGLDVAERMDLSPSRASRVIDRMVNNGYLIRKEDPVDRRRCTIYLAKKGISVKKKIDKIKTDCEKSIRNQLTDDELKVFTQSLQKIMDIL